MAGGACKAKLLERNGTISEFIPHRWAPMYKSSSYMIRNTFCFKQNKEAIFYEKKFFKAICISLSVIVQSIKSNIKNRRVKDSAR